MNETMQSGMDEATRLTRAGRLGEATQLIQRLLGGTSLVEPGHPERPPHPEARTEGLLLDLRPDQVRVEPASPGPVAPEPADEPGPADERGRRRLSDILDRLKKGEIGAGYGPLGGLTLDLDGLPGLGDLPGRSRRNVVEEPLPEGARFETRRYACAAGSRSYRLYVPASRNGRPGPLVVMLHGCTQDASDFAAGTGMNRQAEVHGCIVLYPEQAQGANPNRCWNWFEPAHQRAGAGEPAIIAGMVREVMQEQAVDPERVFVAGLSAGGAMAAVMAATHPELFKALGVHSGLAYEVANDIPTAFAAMRGGSENVGRIPKPMPTIVFHGDGDRTVHPANGDRVVRQWQAGAAGGPVKAERDQGVTEGGRRYSRTRTLRPDGSILVEQWRLHGAGHAWAGGSESGSYTDPAGPDASAEMLRFFLEAARDA